MTLPEYNDQEEIEYKLNMDYISARMDIIEAFDNPLKLKYRKNGRWVYSVDPETMEFTKNLNLYMLDNMELEDLFMFIKKHPTLEELIYNKNK